MELPKQTPTPISLKAAERAHILRVMEFTKGNITWSAKILGIGRETLYRRLKGYRSEQV